MRPNKTLNGVLHFFYINYKINDNRFEKTDALIYTYYKNVIFKISTRYFLHLFVITNNILYPRKMIINE